MTAVLTTHGDHTGLADTDDNLVAECPKCRTALYTTSFTADELADSERGADEFVPVGGQPACVTGGAPPPCAICGSDWLWLTLDGTHISTQRGTIVYGGGQ